jgi:hypothetical protein
MKMLKASAVRGVVIPVEAAKADETGVYFGKGSPEPTDNGYVRFFPDGQELEAQRWINHQRKKWGKKLLTKKEMKYEKQSRENGERRG